MSGFDSIPQEVINGMLSWRKAKQVLPLSDFDYPIAHRRSRFDPNMLYVLTAPRMAGYAWKPTEEEICEAIRTADESGIVLGYFDQLFRSYSVLEVKFFRHTCGASLYELARMFHLADVHQPMVVEWINGLSISQKISGDFLHRWCLDTGYI